MEQGGWGRVGVFASEAEDLKIDDAYLSDVYVYLSGLFFFFFFNEGGRSVDSRGDVSRKTQQREI